MLERHIDISIQLQKKAMEALARIKSEELSPRDIREFIKLAAELERQSRIYQTAGGEQETEETTTVDIYIPMKEGDNHEYGNWKIKPAAGMFFKRSQVGSMLAVVPDDVISFVRAWDLAATSEAEGGKPAYTAGVLMGKRRNGRYIIIDVINVRQSAAEVRATLRHTAEADRAKYKSVKVRIPQDPGQAGKDQSQSLIKHLAGFSVKAVHETGSKETRAEPVAAQWQAGNFDIVTADWNEAYFSQLESFPESKFKDMVDATSTAFSEIEQVFDLCNLI